jgi:hypothetical protein
VCGENQARLAAAPEVVVTKSPYSKSPFNRKPDADERQLPRIIMQPGLEPPVVPAGYGCIRADEEISGLMALRAGLQAQLELLDDFIIERLEDKAAAQKRRS